MEDGDLRESIMNLVDFNEKSRFLYLVLPLIFPFVISIDLSVSLPGLNFTPYLSCGSVRPFVFGVVGCPSFHSVLCR
jgi:hypothetical protein